MFCSKCGKEIPDNSSFCQFWGNKIEFVEQKEENHEFKQTTPSVEFGEYTDARKKAVTLTLTAGIIGLLFLLMVLIFGFNFATIILAVLLMVFLTMRTAAYKKSEVTQEDIDAFYNHYREKIKNFDEKPEGYKQNFRFQSPEACTGVNRINVYLTPAKKKGLLALVTAMYIVGAFSLAFGVACIATGMNGFGMNIDGTYIQTAPTYQGNNTIQVGKNAYKVEGKEIYYCGSYENGGGVWSGPFNYHRFGNKVTFRFTGGGFDRDITLYFTNFGNDIATDRFGFNVVYKRGK